MMNLIDRRLNGRNKSAVNRARFVRRYKEQIRKAVKDMVAERSITDMDKGGEVSVPAKDIAEGDAVIGLASSGVHSNGFSLVRKIVEASSLGYEAPAPFSPVNATSREPNATSSVA